jgi:hypothetical protein
MLRRVQHHIGAEPVTYTGINFDFVRNLLTLGDFGDLMSLGNWNCLVSIPMQNQHRAKTTREQLHLAWESAKKIHNRFHPMIDGRNSQ